MAGKKSTCPECGEKLRVPEESESIAPIDINPRMSDVYELIESICSLDFCKVALLVQVRRFNDSVETIKLKNMQLEARDNLGLKMQAELWEHEAARCEAADVMGELKRENRALKQQLLRAAREQTPATEMRAPGTDDAGFADLAQLEVDHRELDRLENINRMQADQINEVLQQLEAQQQELQQLRVSQKESLANRERLCEEIARLNRIIADVSGRLKGSDKITRVAIA